MDHISNIIAILKKCNSSKLSKVVDENNNFMTNGELLNELKLLLLQMGMLRHVK